MHNIVRLAEWIVSVLMVLLAAILVGMMMEENEGVSEIIFIAMIAAVLLWAAILLVMSGKKLSARWAIFIRINNFVCAFVIAVWCVSMVSADGWPTALIWATPMVLLLNRGIRPNISSRSS